MNLSDAWDVILEEERVSMYLHFFLIENNLTDNFDLFDYIYLNDFRMSSYGGKYNIMVSGHLKANGEEFDFFVKTFSLDNIGQMVWNKLADELKLTEKGMKKFDLEVKNGEK